MTNRVSPARLVVKYKYILTYAVISLLIVLSAHDLIAIYSSSDTLFIPALFVDIARHRDTLAMWQLPPAGYYFPDMVIYGASNLIFHDFRAAVAMSAVLQVFLFLSGGRSIYLQLGGRRNGAFPASALCLLGGLVGVFALAVPVTYLFEICIGPLFTTAVHFGAVIGGVWAISLMTRYLRSEALPVLGALGMMTAACSFSDLLFVAWFVVPATAALALLGLLEKHGRRRFVVCLATILSFALVSCLISLNIRHVTLSYVQSNAHTREQVFELIYKISSWSVQDKLFVSVMVLALLISIYLFTRDDLRWPTDRARCAAWQAAAPHVLVFAALASIGSSIAFRLVTEVPELRYLQPAIFFPLLFLSIKLAFMIDRRFARIPAVPAIPRAVPIGATCLLAAVPSVWLLAAMPIGESLPAPRELACFSPDVHAAGLADYWHARPLTLFSDERLQVVQVRPDGRFFWWINNRYWVSHSFMRQDVAPDYSFIVMAGLQPVEILAQYGQPSRTLSCAGGEIWFYERSGALAEKVLRTYREQFPG
jgi:hypothetical protein